MYKNKYETISYKFQFRDKKEAFLRSLLKVGRIYNKKWDKIVWNHKAFNKKYAEQKSKNIIKINIRLKLLSLISRWGYEVDSLRFFWMFAKRFLTVDIHHWRGFSKREFEKGLILFFGFQSSLFESRSWFPVVKARVLQIIFVRGLFLSEGNEFLFEHVSFGLGFLDLFFHGLDLCFIF